MQSVYFLPVESRVTEGEELSLTVCQDDYSLWYSLQSHRYQLTEGMLWIFCFTSMFPVAATTERKPCEAG